MNTTTQSTRYTLHEQVRQRDLATVFSCTDNLTGTPAFVALLTDLAATNRAFLNALRAELPLLQAADPALLTILDYNLDSAPCYIMAEPLDGCNLRQLLDVAGKGLMPVEALAYTSEAARCVQALHSRGAAHGAIHIDNFVLRGADMVLVTALVSAVFGADLFATTDIYVAYEAIDRQVYVPPEQAAHTGQTPTIAGDMYSLGILLYHLLSGQPPGVAPGSPEVAPWLRGGQTPPLSESIADATVRMRLQKFIQVSTARDPLRRWPDIKTFIAALEQIRPGGTSGIPRISSFHRPLPVRHEAPQILTSTTPLHAQQVTQVEPGKPLLPQVEQVASSEPARLEQEKQTTEAAPDEMPAAPTVAAGTDIAPPKLKPVEPQVEPQVEEDSPALSEPSMQETIDAPAAAYDAPTSPPVIQPPVRLVQPQVAYLVSVSTGIAYQASGRVVSLGVPRTTDFFPDINLGGEPSEVARYVSQHHLDLVYEEGQWYVRPSSTSRNPTFVNGQQIAPGQMQPLYEGAELEIPALKLHFRI